MTQVTILAVKPIKNRPNQGWLSVQVIGCWFTGFQGYTSLCETGRVGAEGVNQIDDFKMGRTDWRLLVVPALVVIDAVWWIFWTDLRLL